MIKFAQLIRQQWLNVQMFKRWGLRACDLADSGIHPSSVHVKAPLNILKSAVIIFSTAGGSQSQLQWQAIFPGWWPIRTPVIRAAELDLTIDSFLLTAWGPWQELCWRNNLQISCIKKYILYLGDWKYKNRSVPFLFFICYESSYAKCSLSANIKTLL